MNNKPRADLFKVEEASNYLRKSKSWLDHARLDGSGPDYVRIGGTIFYARSALDAFIAAKTVRMSA